MKNERIELEKKRKKKISIIHSHEIISKHVWLTSEFEESETGSACSPQSKLAAKGRKF